VSCPFDATRAAKEARGLLTKILPHADENLSIIQKYVSEILNNILPCNFRTPPDKERRLLKFLITPDFL